MTYKLTHIIDGLTLECSIESDEVDCYDSIHGHYTKPGNAYIECVELCGKDIQSILNDDVLCAILDQFNNETKGK